MSETEKNNQTGAAAEDLTASGKGRATIEGVDMNADDWVEQAAAKTHAAEGDDYVKLDRGVLTVNQLNYFLNSMPMELTYADENNQFLYYNNMAPHDEMLAPRYPKQAGDPLSAVHPDRAVEHVKEAINLLRTGKTDIVKMRVPFTGPDVFLMHYYKAMHDENGDYAGVNEFVLDLMPTIKWYLAKTGQKLVDDPDAMSGASLRDKPTVDGASSASVNAKPEDKVDETSGASIDDEPKVEEKPAAQPSVDETSGASIND
ncbi:NADPH-dependent FMN reductase domain protein [Loigolactobacillus coryniformis subsp. coryniformis CECT 5711]|uniref:NADPH-dependent FMN reductase domain protein n=1 Tax=Loigolactobacillus coryniformis subsp. coryniformis CECT 5711 TaxID=1185325 RepID=J2Z469_9LACO|nr:NADPH-dependent FMN reductase domain protein [Loigolactobacillus coryniformis subsp. coryniformis CECT 5711]